MTIGTLDLTIGTRVSDRGPVDSDAVPITEVQELLPGEVSPVVSDDAVENAKPVDDAEEEFAASSERMLVMGLASIHLVNMSIATSR